MPLSRLLCTLLALLSMTAGAGALAPAVLCVAESHVAVESAAEAARCQEAAPAASDGGNLAVAADCVDTAVGAMAVDKHAPAVPPAVALAPARVVAILPAAPPVRFPLADRADAGRPPAHLLPLSGVVLLT